MKTVTDITGNIYGKLQVLKYAKRSPSNKPMWLCKCECGTEKEIIGAALKNGKTVSCGCFHKQQLKERRTTHGMSGSPEYNSWAGMINRCKNPSHKDYALYGGKGIIVIDTWSSFFNFLSDMGNKPGPSYSIERLDGNKNYCPDNCVWATKKQQANNRSNVRVFTYKGVKKTISGWATYSGIAHSKLYHRLVTLNLPIEKALTL